jgi:hypothetical protein
MRNQKILLIQYIKFYQIILYILYYKNNQKFFKFYYLLDFYLNNLLFQVYTIQLFIKKNNNYKLFLFYLKNELQLFLNIKFWNIKYCSLLLTNYFYTQIKQHLFTLILNPFVNINQFLYNFKLKKNYNQNNVFIYYIQKMMLTAIFRKYKWFQSLFLWKINIKKTFEFLNLNWILKFLFIPYNYKFIFKKWIQLKFVTLKFFILNFSKEFVLYIYINFFFFYIINLINKTIFYFNILLKNSYCQKLKLNFKFFNVIFNNFISISFSLLN